MLRIRSHDCVCRERERERETERERERDREKERQRERKKRDLECIGIQAAEHETSDLPIFWNVL